MMIQTEAAGAPIFNASGIAFRYFQCCSKERSLTKMV